MSKFLFYVIALGVVIVLLPKMDFINMILILSIIFHVFFQVGAIISIVNEDILYSGKEKLFRTLLVIFIPIIGILIEYINAKKHDKKTYQSSGGEDTTTGGSGYFTGFGAGMMGFGEGDSGGGGGE